MSEARPDDDIGHGSATAGLAARRVATTIFHRVIAEGRSLEEELTQAARDLSGPDLALARAIASAALRHMGETDAAISGHLKKPLPAKASRARAILATGVAQLLFLRVPAHAAIDLAVRQVKAEPATRHLAGLVNAVLRQIDRQRPPPVAPEANVPEPFRSRWRANWGEAALAAMAAELAGEPPLDLTVKGDAAAWAERLGAVVLPTGSLRIVRPHGRIEDLAGYEEGEWWVQDAAAALPVRLAGEVVGLRALDLFAAPGGKTAQLAAAGATVTALDISPERMQRVRANLARLRLAADRVVADALAFEAAEPFDVVLVDAPCSATGTARRNPDVLHRRTLADIDELAGLQRRLLAHAAGLTRPAGLMIYCTCSLEPEEGEAQAAHFLAARPDFERVPVTAGEIGGLSHLIDENGDVRTRPGQPIGQAGSLDGFFIARFRRRPTSLADR